ncbi:TIGR03619 family F420-dependent LLM class oxidoreductase [Minwuia thermotolerans]|uniref:LLM class F420-dependent oxidoreductase n=1 Tax=Minwuia thermotolerans TaxID=2056226 RepID=A0A2M9G6E6_9PROT|nr:TIGR03619 family F420-dependent LLM class oxidoreductase [Minwuia thermotolerans]PJK31295.1 LLM class F420-dependent oxidoreductase [Minwuia thermotolerans]
MELTVEFPSIAYREGPEGVARMARAIERIGYDRIDIFDHVVMGYPVEGREPSPYPAKMPILEALTLAAHLAALTERVGLGTEVLVLPQRDAVLVAKQISTIDTLSGGRMRLGVGVGWQPSEYEALGFDYADRGERMDEAIDLVRACWRDERIDHRGRHFTVNAMAMEPKPPQAPGVPLWVGGNSGPAFRRVGRVGDGWLASRVTDAAYAASAMDRIREAAVKAGRDPAKLGFQSMIAPPPREGDDAGKAFYADHERVAARAAELKDMGFGAVALNATAIFQAGARSVDAMADELEKLHGAIRRACG